MLTNADRRFEEGLEQFRRSNYLAAIRIWKALMDEGHPHPNLGLYLWAAQSEYGRMLDSVDRFTSALQPAGAAPEASDSLTEARKALGQQRPRDALELLRGVVQASPEAAAPRVLAARAAIKCGRLAEASLFIEEAVRLKPQDPEVLVVRGQVQAEMGRPEEAIASYRQALAASDRVASAWYGLAAVRYRDKRLADTERFLERALECAPGLTEAHLFLDDVRQERRRTELGLEQCRQAVAEHPQYADWQYRRGVMASNLGLDEEALGALDAALSANARMPKAWHQKGLLLRWAGNHRGACEALRHCAALLPGADRDICRKAEAMEQAERHEEAAALWLSALKLEPDYASRHIETGKRFYGEGMADEAERALARGLSLAPHYPDGHYFLARIALDRGQPSEAIGHLKTALSLSPQYGEAALKLVEAFLADGNRTAAKHTLEQWKANLALEARFATALRDLEQRANDETLAKDTVEKGASGRRTAAADRDRGKGGRGGSRPKRRSGAR